FRKLGRTKSSPRPRSDEEPETTEQTQPVMPMPVAERWLLKLMLTQEELVAWIAERLNIDWLQHPDCKRIAEARISAFRASSWTGVAGFLDIFQDEAARNLITEAVTDPRKIADPEKTLKGDSNHSDKRGILER